ncbi:hypothetical protein O7614_27500 [Micromonospora sp. WMMD961]|uniref:hypothetical protein n=1 Tax=Micromonospora sp. WMMD961 TaxID=3016100 RepID=UPI00241695C0|nr:hypothetical protein [Micromonospora sp. WMMD961]MDG4783404.1 hypothetical protein [Micromonospora sp. WMMD961]
MTTLKSGDVVLIGSACSVQFSRDRALRIRLVSIGDVDSYHGWVWLTGYVLDAKGAATDRREVYVQRAGIIVEQKPPASLPAGRSGLPVSSQTRVIRERGGLARRTG